MTKFSKLLRLAVIYSNNFWLFLVLNKLPYRYAINGFLAAFQSYVEIKSIYLRHSLVTGNWVPGLSDIDLTVVIDGRLTTEREFSFLKAFWKKYDQLKTWFPMLGEVGILTEAHFETWTRFTIRGYESRNWRLLHGIDTLKLNYAECRWRIHADSLNHALTTYWSFFLPKFYEDGPSHYLLRKEMQRLAMKVLTYLEKYDTGHGAAQTDRTVGHLGPSDLFALIVRRLEAHIRRYSAREEPTGLEDRDETSPPAKSDFRPSSLSKRTIDLSCLEPCRGAIECICLSRTIHVIVLKTGLETAVLKSAIRAIRLQFGKGDIKPIVVCPTTFHYLLRYYRPDAYAQLLHRRDVPMGNDILPEIPPPPAHSIARALLEQSQNILTFPQTQRFVSSPGLVEAFKKENNSILTRFLFMKLYLEKGIFMPGYEKRLAECQRWYPGYFEKFDELKKTSLVSNNDGLRMEWFRFFKDIAGETHRTIASVDVEKALFLGCRCKGDDETA